MSLSREHKDKIRSEYAQPLFNELSPTTPGFDQRFNKFIAVLTQYSIYIGKWNFNHHFQDYSPVLKKFMMLYLTANPAFGSPAAIRTYMRELITEFRLSSLPKDSLHTLNTEVTECEQNFYAVGEVVETTQLKTGVLYCRYERYSSIDPNILRASLDLDKQESIRVFKNLYEALEYLTYTSPRVSGTRLSAFEKSCALWVVNCNSEIQTQAITETITLNKNSSYIRQASITYWEVDRKKIAPLAVTVLSVPSKNGLDYKTLNCSFMNEPVIEEKPKETCRIM